MTVRSRSRHVRTAAVAGVAVAGLTLSACGSTTAAGDGPAPGEPLQVVASTSVWGSVTKAVGGEDVEVNAIIDDPSADPHSYESSPRDAAEVSKADLVVFNGGGYDEFMQQILSSTAQTTPKVQAFQGENTHDHGEQGHAEPPAEHGHGEEGHGQPPADHAEPGHGEPSAEHGQAPGHSHADEGHAHEHSNEHIWYDLGAVREVSTKVAHELGELRPELRQAFLDRATRFADQVGGLEHRVDDMANRHQGAKVIVTEPLAHYMIERAKLQDITPQEFVRSVESGGDPSVASVAEIRKAVDSGEATALIYNPQTESRVTEQVRTQAEQRGLPVVRLTETAPEGQDYVAWMDAQITALDAALSSRG